LEQVNNSYFHHAANKPYLIEFALFAIFHKKLSDNACICIAFMLRRVDRHSRQHLCDDRVDVCRTGVLHE